MTANFSPSPLVNTPTLTSSTVFHTIEHLILCYWVLHHECVLEFLNPVKACEASVLMQAAWCFLFHDHNFNLLLVVSVIMVLLFPALHDYVASALWKWNHSFTYSSPSVTRTPGTMLCCLSISQWMWPCRNSVTILYFPIWAWNSSCIVLVSLFIYSEVHPEYLSVHWKYSKCKWQCGMTEDRTTGCQVGRRLMI